MLQRSRLLPSPSQMRAQSRCDMSCLHHPRLPGQTDLPPQQNGTHAHTHTEKKTSAGCASANWRNWVPTAPPHDVCFRIYKILLHLRRSPGLDSGVMGEASCSIRFFEHKAQLCCAHKVRTLLHRLAFESCVSLFARQQCDDGHFHRLREFGMLVC